MRRARFAAGTELCKDTSKAPPYGTSYTCGQHTDESLGADVAKGTTGSTDFRLMVMLVGIKDARFAGIGGADEDVAAIPGTAFCVTRSAIRMRLWT
jgi:hypothetical protein